MTCKVPYSIEKQKTLVFSLNSLWRHFKKNKNVGYIKEQLLKLYPIDKPSSISLSNLTSNENQQFYDAVNEFTIRQSNSSSLAKIPPEWEEFRQAVLSTFFDLSTEKKGKSFNNEETAAETDDEIDERTLTPINEAALNIYGPQNVVLVQNVNKKFYNQLTELLIVNIGLARKYSYNVVEINKLISRYKQDKFNKILSFLKQHYPQNSRLSGITGMYSYGQLLATDFRYVMDLFQKYIQSQNGINSILNDQVMKKTNYAHKDKQKQAYNQLLEYIKKNDELKDWFYNKFDTDRLKEEVTYLYSGENFSNYYKIIKDALQDEIEAGNNTVIELIDIIENTDYELVDAVDDYFILSQFDYLLQHNLKEYLTIDDQYIVGTEALTQESFKYLIYDKHSHQRRGFESGNDESSEKHTSVMIKNILEKLPIFKYNEFNQETPQMLDLASISSAWLSFVRDLLSNGAHIELSKKIEDTDITEYLRNLLFTIQDDMFGNTIKIFKVLFDGSYRGIDYFTGGILLNEQHKNILYSFYKHVLQKDSINDSSFYAQESERLNDHKGKLELTIDMVQILHRNVNNNFLDCDIRNGTVQVRSKFSWDAQLFDLVENIASNSKRDQRAPEINKEWVNRFESNNNSAGITLYVQNQPYYFGFTYGNTNKKIFTNSNVLHPVHSQKTIQKEVTRGQNKRTVEVKEDILNILANIDLVEFKKKILVNGNIDTSRLNEDELLLVELLKMFDHYLSQDFLTELGLDILQTLKTEHKADPKSGIYSKNYLDPLLRITFKLIEAQKQALIAKDKNMSLKTYLETDKTALYGKIYEDQIKLSDPDIISFEGPEVYFIGASIKNQTLINIIKAKILNTGESMKSTIVNKQGARVSNYNVARAGSRLYQRLYTQRQQISAAQKLLFVQNPDLLDPDPIIDAEVTNSLGDVKTVREMTESELFSHAIVDKFYGSYLTNEKILFQPTVYSDKIQFFNYYTKLTFLGENPLNMYNDNTDTLIQLYANTFFGAHSTILESVFDKIEKLINFSGFVSTESTRFDVVNSFLKSKTREQLNDLVMQYNKANPNDVIELELDKDYRVFNGHCAVNEILREYSLLSSDPVRLKKFLDNQLQLFVQDIENYNTSLKVFDYNIDLNKWVNNESLPYVKYNGILRALSDKRILKIEDRARYAKEWISPTGELRITNEQGEVNPFLKKFFFIEGLSSNNLRLSLTGSEINHPDKAFGTLFRQVVDANNKYNKGEISLTIYKKILVNNELFTNETSDEDIISFSQDIHDLSLAELRNYTGKWEKQVNIIYDKSIIEVINTGQGTQFKRNVIIPATLETPLTGLIDGMSNEVNVAVVYDMQAPVNNLRYSKEIDSQDGSARMSYIQYKLENNGLGDHKVGTNRKPIWDAQTEDLTSFLAKFAAFVNTNATMAQSKGSVASDYLLFKKMHNIRWNGSIDATSSIYNLANSPYSQTSVDRWFKTRILEGQCLYYKNKDDQIIEITGFGKDQQGYFTKEKIKGTSRSVVVHHYFDDNSNHYTKPIEGGHPIDSLYELYVALGGINCVDKEGKASEFTQDVLTNFVINVGYKKNQGKISSASDVVQPLRDKFIAYVLNNTAVKNGAKNINSADRWTDDKAFNTFRVKTGGLGIQLNADHDVINSEMTEFSQVIAACAAYGKEFGFTSELFYGLGKSAAIASRKELEAIQEYLTKATKDPVQAKYDLYVIIGKLLINSASNSEFDLTEQIKQEVEQTFKKNKNKSEDKDLKIPFSDPSLYRQFISSITSVINKKSIKRKHPGASYVMVPAYNVIQYYQLYDAKTNTYKEYMFQDIVTRAKKEFKEQLLKALEPLVNEKTLQSLKVSSFSSILEKAISKGVTSEIVPYLNHYQIQDITNYERAIVQTYLSQRQQNERFRSKEWFMPTDIVNIVTDKGTFTYNLDDMSDFYKFKNGIFDVECENNVTVTTAKGRYIITSKKDKNHSIILTKNYKTGVWEMFYNGQVDEETRLDMINAALQLLPKEAIFNLSPNTQMQTNSVITEQELQWYNTSMDNITKVKLDVVKPVIITYLTADGVTKEETIQQYKKIGDINTHKYQLNITAPYNLKPSLIRWRYDQPVDLEQLNIVKSQTYDKPWKTDPTQFNKAFMLYLGEDKTRGFEIVKDHESKYWSIHFKTLVEGETYETAPKLTEEQKQRLFQAAAAQIPMGEYLSTYGELTPGGVSGINRFNDLGFEQVNQRTVKDREGNDISIPVFKKVGKYMTIYDHPIIRNSWNKPKNERPKQSEIQEVLDLLHKDKLILNGQEINIVEGSLENTEAQLVLGNMYSKVFDTKGLSLADILEMGPEFFKDQALDEIEQLPKGFYHLALLKSNGKHTLISLDNVLETGMYQHSDQSTILTKSPIDTKDEEVKNNEIYDKKGIKIGKYIPSTWQYRDGKVYDGDTEIEQDRYKLIFEPNSERVQEVLERINYIYKYQQQNSIIVGDKTQTFSYDLYKIGSLYDIARSFYVPRTDNDGKVIQYNDLDDKEKARLTTDAKNQIASIIENIYEKDKYNDIRINPGRLLNLKPEDKKKVQERISEYLSKIGKATKEVNNKQVNLTNQELLDIDPKSLAGMTAFQRYIVNVRRLLLTDNFDSQYKSLYSEHYRSLKLYNKRYVSFLNSLYFISSRIPAQSLQSFMPMRCIGWTSDSNNTAYVSYIQTFLQGSDYDIDKAYIMGQSFDNGVYVGWSNLFDYSTIETLKASKELPIPRGTKFIENNASKYNIDEDLDEILAIKHNKAKRLRLIGKLIKKINNNQYYYNYTNNNRAKKVLMDRIIKHSTYDIPDNLKNMAYKNVSSANIFNIVHSVINRDQAYSDITMRDLSQQADKSPKGIKTKQLNMVNPLTKYIMQYQNLVGKDVIGIAANGEKDWFNITYWYHDILRNGNEKDRTYLLMNHTYERIQGRARKVFKENTVKIIPDLWHADDELKTKLKALFIDQGLVEEDDKYVDQLISQLLSAATDNAKELILNKINAGTQLAKYHLHLMMLGFSLDDIVAFMTSPVVELVDKYSKSDIYSKKDGSINIAINILRGKIKLSSWILPEFSQAVDAEDILEYYESMDFDDEGGQASYSWISKHIKPYTQVQAKSLKDFIQKYFKARLDNMEDNERELLAPLVNYTLPTDTNNINANYLFKYLNKIISDVKKEINDYKDRTKTDYTMKDFEKDLSEFETITKQANETSTLASVWLKLNQGIPQVDEDLVKLIRNMRKSVSDREEEFGIHRIRPRRTIVSLLDKDEISEDKVLDKKQEYLEALRMLRDRSGENKVTGIIKDIIDKIRKNNDSLEYDYVVNTLYDAVKYDIYANFDLYKFLADEKIAVNPDDSRVHYNSRIGEEVSYREMAADYYNLIKASWNILDMVNRIPTYHQNINLLNYTLHQRMLFANKAAIIDELLSLPEFRNKSIDERQYKEISQYVDKIIVTSFFFNLKDKPIVIQNIPNAKVYTDKYDLVESDFIHLDTLNGIDSLKYFVENYLVTWLQKDSKYKNNAFVKGLTMSSYYGKDLLKPKLDLSKIYDSYVNKHLYNQYLLGFQELLQEKTFGEYSIGDIFMLYNLAVNRNKVGGKFLTAIFKNSITEDTILHEYYSFLGNNDNSVKQGQDKYKYIAPTRKDFLIAVAPVVRSKSALQYRRDPYVKVLNPMTGFDVYKFGSEKYNKQPETMLDLEGSEIIPKEQQDLRLYYYSKSLNMFPELHRKMTDTNIFKEADNMNIIETISRLKDVLFRYSREGRLVFSHENCI